MGNWTACSREGKAAKVSESKIWKEPEYLFKEIGLCSALWAMVEGRGQEENNLYFRRMILTKWMEKTTD